MVFRGFNGLSVKVVFDRIFYSVLQVPGVGVHAFENL
jgi:hypothetical protein